MKINRIEVAGIIAAFMLAVLGGVFFVTQSVAHADTDPCSLPGMGTVLDCDDTDTQMEVPVDPCDITPCGGEDGDTLAEQINCEIYRELVKAGDPIPQGFDASGCDDDNGGGGDSPACSDGVDNDGDSLVDSADPGCADANDDDESNGGGGGGGGTTPACSDNNDNDGDGKIDRDDPGCSDPSDNDETDSTGGGGNNGGGNSGGQGGSSEGSVLGNASCDKYLTAFIKFGQNNDTEQVKRLQYVLKNFEGAGIEENGTYDQATLSAVHSFQTKYWDTILAPWNIKQSTGFVYLTTRKKVNEIYCKNLVAFPLSADENAVIEKTKVTPVKVISKATAPDPKPVEKAVKPKIEGASKATTSESEAGATRSGWGAVGDFFRRIFNRGR